MRGFSSFGYFYVLKIIIVREYLKSLSFTPSITWPDANTLEFFTKKLYEIVARLGKELSLLTL